MECYSFIFFCKFNENQNTTIVKKIILFGLTLFISPFLNGQSVKKQYAIAVQHWDSLQTAYGKLYADATQAANTLDSIQKIIPIKNENDLAEANSLTDSQHALLKMARDQALDQSNFAVIRSVDSLDKVLVKNYSNLDYFTKLAIVSPMELNLPLKPFAITCHTQGKATKEKLQEITEKSKQLQQCTNELNAMHFKMQQYLAHHPRYFENQDSTFHNYYLELKRSLELINVLFSRMGL